MKRDCLRIIKAGINASKPEIILPKLVKLKSSKLLVGKKVYLLSRFDGIVVIGGGKASGNMAIVLEKIFGKYIKDGIVNVKYGDKVKTKLIRLNQAGHPLPDKNSLKGTKEMIKILRENENSLTIILISGGGSALMEMLPTSISLRDLRKLNEMLIKCGAEIEEINAVRKHISLIKGGKLMRFVKNHAISLILSDVVGDRLDSIASGPTVPDPTTFFDAYEVLRKYRLLRKIPKSVLRYIEKGIEGKVEETLKPDDKAFERVYNLLIGTNRISLNAMKKESIMLGYKPLILTSYLKGESKEVGKVLASIVKELAFQKKRIALLAGGETTVTVKGKGIGGPNLELLLSFLLEARDIKNFTACAVDSDGEDGSTDAAGALVNDSTLSEGLKIGLNPRLMLENNDSYTFFKRTKNLLFTGKTGTNVNHLICILLY